ncbi:MAG: hypothetical protein WCS69_06855 [Ignavibacteriaceae bacterium]|jgi:hypothetical protein
MRKLSLLIIVVLLAGKLSAQSSPHGAIPFDCSDCHVSTSWKEIPSQKKFNHNATRFALVGQHKSVDCKQCHATLKFSEAKEECVSCHKDIHKNTTSQQCSNCHTPTTWLIKNITDLHQRSRFPLLGQHAKADCQQCHLLFSQLNFEPLGVKCFDCHRQNYMATQNPNHAQSGFSTECQTCHNFTDAAWGYASFAHDFFPLQGGHKITNCFSCHKAGTFTGLSKDCYACHKNKFEQTVEPNHVSAGFSTTCTSCHNINGWKPTSFNHTQYFSLVGAHTQLGCNKCHSTSYKNTPTDCYGCHKNTFESTTNPSHVASKFPTDCSQCHTNTAWIPSSFNHSSTNFPLTGMHTTATCISCHVSGYTNTPSDCYSCHKTNYDTTTDPNHVTSQFPTTCNQCHSTSGWKPATFDHATTQFPLTGAHQSIACNQCHASGYTGTPKDCYSCHKTNYESTTDPNHVASQFPTTCNQCHSTSGWKPATFDHATTQFPLTGAHQSIACNQCHASGYTGTPKDCYSCHKTNYESTTDPNHVTLQFPTTCIQCHSTTAWKPSTFNHATTQFPLTGAHQSIACNQCHASGYTGTPTDCYSCHKTNYESTTDPNHVTLQFPTTCTQCHSTTAWKPATFDHATTQFPLTGAHQSIACNQCHASGYTGTPTDCYSCHKTNYESTTDPNHVASLFPTTCIQCHSTTAWKPSTFNHATTQFPLTGAHISVDCAKCHAGGYTNTPTDCYNCHKSNYDNTTNPKHSTTGFSTACKDCHTTTAWVPATFDHSKYFPIASGRHSGISCTTCHTTSNYVNFTCLSSGCHSKSSTDGDHDGVNGYSYLSSECYRCHPSGSSGQIKNFIKTLEK